MKEKIIAELTKGTLAPLIAQTLGCTLKEVREVEKELKGNDFKALEGLEDTAISLIAEQAKKGQSNVIKKEIQKATKKISKANRLSDEFMETLTVAAKVSKELLEAEDLKLRDWKLIVDTLSDAYDTMFGSSTQVNIDARSGDNTQSNNLTQFRGVLSN